jgi:hypothetical protein
MAPSIRHDDIVLAALIYRRNVGADLDSIRTFAFIREAKKQTSGTLRAKITSGHNISRSSKRRANPSMN